MSSSDPPTPSASLNIDPRLHNTMQDGAHERSTTSSDPQNAALQHLYNRQREQHASSEYGPDVQALLKTLPANALPPNLASAAGRDEEDASYPLYPADSSSPHHSGPPPDHANGEHHDLDHDGDALDDENNGYTMGADGELMLAPGGAGRKKRAGDNPDDWTRVRKDNHKEVERRRRSAINTGINDLSALMPSGGSGDKAKGAILSRAVTYIRQLKENEGRNIEKWTLEKLLMDQAMSDLQAQFEDLRQRWEADQEKIAQLEAEVVELRAQSAGGDSAAKRPRTGD